MTLVEVSPGAHRTHLREGSFRIHAVETVDQGMEILTGMESGVRDANGQFPDGSVNARVEARLQTLADGARRFASDHSDTEESKS